MAESIDLEGNVSAVHMGINKQLKVEERKQSEMELRMKCRLDELRRVFGLKVDGEMDLRVLGLGFWGGFGGWGERERSMAMTTREKRKHS